LTLFTQLATEAVDGGKKGEAMTTLSAPSSAATDRAPPSAATDPSERLARLRARLDQQDEKWNRARRTLAAIDAATVDVPKAFLEQLDELAGARPFHPNGVRV
jgi:hypothetical protein